VPRLFAAVDLPPDWKSAFSAAVAGVAGCGGRPTPPENLHVTVFFLGETEQRLVPELIGGLAASVSLLAPFCLAFSRLRPQADRMLWAAFADSPDWRRLCGAVRLAAAPFAAKPASREQTAHVTLARFKRGGASLAAPVSFTPPEPSLAVTAVELVRSELAPRGPAYFREHRFELAGGHTA
jgi:2'-5' RNA ligase